jgi:hypothetical protein
MHPDRFGNGEFGTKEQVGLGFHRVIVLCFVLMSKNIFAINASVST